MSNLHSLLPELSIVPQYHSVGMSAEEEAGAGKSVAHSVSAGDGADEYRRELAAKTEELEGNYRHELEMARKSWAEDAGKELAELIEETLAGLEACIGHSLQQIMLPFVGKLIPRAAMIDFMQILENALQEDFRGPLCLSGPDDLITELKVLLAAKKIEIISDPSTGMELRARTKNFVVTTRIKNWTDGIVGADS